MAPRGLPPAVALEISAPLGAEATPARLGHRPHQADGHGQSPLGRRARPRRAPQARHHRAKSTIQRYIAQIRCKPPPGQRWSTFLRNQAHGVWACDLFEVRDVWFRSHHVFVVMHLETRRLLLAVTTGAPNAAWLAQQLRNLTPFGEGPKFLLRDHDAKFATVFDAVARGAGIRVVRTPIRAPKANSYVERLIGTLRRECTDHILVLGEAHLQQVLDEYRAFYNDGRPHQGIGQRRPSRLTEPARGSRMAPGAISARSVLGGLHYDYRVAA